MTISERIKKRRKELHITQEELANKLGLSDKSSISIIENSGDNVTMKNVTRIAEVLSIKPEFLLGWDNQQEHIHCVLDNNYENQRKDLDDLMTIARVSDPSDIKRVTDLLIRLNN